MAPSHDHRPSGSDGLHPPRRSHHRSRSREHSPEASSRPKPDPRYYTSRYASPQPPTRGYPSTQPHVYPNTPVKRTWPPAPVVEDEKTALAKEANGPKVADSDVCEACNRGSADQQPIILEVDQPRTPPSNPEPRQSKYNRDSRGLYASNETRPEEVNTGERGRQGSAEESLGLPETIFTRRAASPYAFTPKAPYLSTDSGYYSFELKSADVTPLADRQRGARSSGDSSTSDALRGNGKTRGSVESDACLTAEVDSSLDEDSESTVGSRESRVRAPAPYSFHNGAKTVTRDFPVAEQQPRLAEIKAEALDGSRRPQVGDAPRAPPPAGAARRGPPPAPIATPTTGLYPAESPGRGSSRHSSGSRPSSPVGISYPHPPSPPRSPRFGAYPYKTDSPRSARSSVSGSMSGSRPSSPVPLYSQQSSAAPNPEEGIRRSSTFPVVMEDRSQRTSRLAEPSVHVDDEFPSPTISTPSRAGGHPSLPYPVDDMNLMPSEEDHRYKPRALGDPFVPRSPVVSSRPSTRDGPPESPVTSRPVSLAVPFSRPPMSSRHSLNTGLPTLATGLAAAAAMKRGEPESPSALRSPVGGSEKTRSRCLKVQSSRDHEGWYTMIGCAEVFDMCPSCFHSYIAPGSFRNHFQLVQRRAPDPDVICSFRTPWYKLAWQLIQEQQRSNIGPLYDLARATASEANCPGKDRENRIWHAVYDKHGEAVHGFDICPCDVEKIEALMPTLRGVFKESHNSGRRRRCNLRVQSTRCAEYLDELREIDVTASRKRKQPDMTSFIELARHKAQMRECARDDLVVDKEWHFAPQLPEFTVCEECYSSVIWPEIAEGSSVASRFKRTPELVDEEKAVASGRDPRRNNGAAVRAGTSCQLYSPRMRRVFRRAVQADDFGYLATRAKERKEVEMELQAKYARLQTVAKEWERANPKGGERRSLQSQQRYSGLMADFDKIAEDWRKWE